MGRLRHFEPYARRGPVAGEAHLCPPGRGLRGGSTDWPFADQWQGFFDLAQSGRLNVFYLSGAQIDGQGNINLMAVGNYSKPKVRLPGGAGSAILAYVVERVVLFKTTHEARGLVPQVDVITAPGYTPT